MACGKLFLFYLDNLLYAIISLIISHKLFHFKYLITYATFGLSYFFSFLLFFSLQINIKIEKILVKTIKFVYLHKMLFRTLLLSFSTLTHSLLFLIRNGNSFVEITVRYKTVFLCTSLSLSLFLSVCLSMCVCISKEYLSLYVNVKDIHCTLLLKIYLLLWNAAAALKAVLPALIKL